MVALRRWGGCCELSTRKCADLVELGCLFIAPSPPQKSKWGKHAFRNTSKHHLSNRFQRTVKTKGVRGMMPFLSCVLFSPWSQMKLIAAFSQQKIKRDGFSTFKWATDRTDSDWEQQTNYCSAELSVFFTAYCRSRPLGLQNHPNFVPENLSKTNFPAAWTVWSYGNSARSH